MTVKKKMKELLNGLGMLTAAFAMMAIAIAFIFLVHAMFPHKH